MNMIVQGTGPKPCKIMLIGEHPGKEELRQGEVFVGRAGQEYDKLLWKYGFSRSEVRTDNILADLPTGDKGQVTDEDLYRNSDRLDLEIYQTDPDIIVAMGHVATRYFLENDNNNNNSNVRYDVHTVHAIPHQLKHLSLPHVKTVTLFPTFNPAAGLHDADSFQYLHYDFRMLQAFVAGRLRLPDRVDRFAGPSIHVDTVAKFKSSIVKMEYNPIDNPALAIDTEGGVKSPWGLSYTGTYQHGYVVLAEDRDVIDALRTYIYRCRPDIVLHYAIHDLSVLRSLGIDLIDAGCRIWDTMVLAYLLQIEPQGLKNLCYRHLGMLMKDYVDLVGPYSLNKQLDYILRINEIDWPMPDPIIEDKKTHTKVRQPQNLNRRINGILSDLESGIKIKEVDIWKRWMAIDDAVRLPATSQFGNIPIANLDDVPWEEARDYSGADARGTLTIFPRLLERVREMELEPCLMMDLAILPMIDEMQSTGFKADIPYLENLSAEYKADMRKIRHQIRQKIGYSINPESTDDVKELFFKRLRLPSYKRTKGGQPSTSEKAVESLRTSNPIVDLVLDHRELNKSDTSFVQPALYKARADADGRAKGKINYTRVVSGRISMSSKEWDGDPGFNLLAIPVRNDNGRRIRNGFIAEDGYLLGSWDLNQIEMRFMAHESQDEFLIDAYLNNRDIHTETAAATFGVRPEDVTPTQRYGSKRTGFSVITGITPSGLLDVFRKEGVSGYDEDDCKKFIDGWLDRCQGVKKYLSNCRAEVRRYGMVRESIRGRIRYLPAVYALDDRIREEALRQSHSHKISAGAQSIMKLIQIEIGKFINQLRSEGAKIRWLLQIYDEIILEFEEGLETILDPMIRSIMAETVKISVPIKGTGHWGKRWGEIK